MSLLAASNSVVDADAVALARKITSLSARLWGAERAVELIGRHPSWVATIARVERLAAADGPMLILGETGTGKELLARALFLLAGSHCATFVTVNCAQYANDQLLASELFGHKKGSFTGAVTDHTGVLEAAEGGIVCLDEVGELSASAQAMLLRAIGEREILPVGASRPKQVNVRVVASTNRDLRAMVDQGKFRRDLYYRLNQLRVSVPPLRERGDDWELIACHHLDRLAARHRCRKMLAADTTAALREYSWPGNIRELIGCVQTGYHLSAGSQITLPDLADALEAETRDHQLQGIPLGDAGDGRCARAYCDALARGDGTFWERVAEPFMARELNREQVRAVVVRGLEITQGSYKRLLPTFGIPEHEYLRFMDFLRHHDLKPTRPGGGRSRERFADREARPNADPDPADECKPVVLGRGVEDAADVVPRTAPGPPGQTGVRRADPTGRHDADAEDVTVGA